MYVAIRFTKSQKTLRITILRVYVPEHMTGIILATQTIFMI